MANSKKLISFITQNIEKYDINILDLSWPKRLNLSYCDLHLEAKFNGKVYEGRGTADDFDTALQIAFVESLERSVRETKNLETTNGLAGHSSLEEAIQSSKNELIERHIFLNYFKSALKFPQAKSYKTNNKINSIINYLKSNNVEVVVSIIEVNNEKHFCLVSLFGFNVAKKFGMIIGSALTNSEEKSVEKALTESIRFYVYIADNPEYGYYDENDFSSLTKPNFEDHGRLALNLDYAQWFKNTYFDERERSFIQINQDINIEVYNDIFTEDIPIKFVRACSPTMYDLYVGKQANDLKPHPFR